jgi:hypothetical protein
MNCLTHLLDLWEKGNRFKIYYDGNHYCGVNEEELFDLNGTFKKCILSGNAGRYLPIEHYHNAEVTKHIFGLNKRYSKVLEEYYEVV